MCQSRGRSVVLTLVSAALASASAAGNPVTWTASQGSLAASAKFEVFGSDLVVTLTNTSLVDVFAPSDVLTAVFFDKQQNGDTMFCYRRR